MSIWITLIAPALPFILWPIEKLFPYPHFVEETAKAILIYSVVVKIADFEDRLKNVLILGFFFAISESILYFLTISLLGNIQVLFIRLFLTTTLHLATCLVIFYPANKNRRLIYPATLVAIIIHFLFNFSLGA
jgi:RsiW-degrading membrane proteinase PrsW (M82 family)